MTAAQSSRLKLDFAKSAAFRREQELFTKDADRRLREKRDADRTDTDLDELNAIVVMATEADITALRIKIDAYDAATVEALMENDRMRDVARARIEELLGSGLITSTR